MSFRQKSVILLATGCFIGKLPIAPGTFGSFAGLPLCLLASKLNGWIVILFIGCFIGFAILIAQAAENIIQKNDPGCIVIDEIAGIMVTFIGLPLNLISIGVGFLLFRLFDIVKPFPIRYLEKNFSGGAGIVFDDVGAGIYSHIILRVLIILFGSN